MVRGNFGTGLFRAVGGDDFRWQYTVADHMGETGRRVLRSCQGFGGDHQYSLPRKLQVPFTFTSDPRQFRVSIFRNRHLYWRGYVTSDLYSENFTTPPYTVTIKAVDGFNLLSSIPFRDLVHIGITGKRSLRELLSTCIDLLELDIDTADWMDLYAEGMDENVSPLHQTYIDLERLYYVYEEPTYRDILELCLRPFAGQIFQSNGALHIRRGVSLYRAARPMSFYRVGTEYPIGGIVTGSGLRLVIHTGAQVVTSASREREDDMWDGQLHVMGESALDIVPALRKVEITVKNKALGDLIARLGFYDRDAWSDQHGFITQKTRRSCPSPATTIIRARRSQRAVSPSSSATIG